MQQLNVEIAEVEELLIGLILEGKVDGRIDQVGMRLELDRAYVSTSPTVSRAHSPLVKHSRKSGMQRCAHGRPH